MAILTLSACICLMSYKMPNFSKKEFDTANRKARPHISHVTKRKVRL